MQLKASIYVVFYLCLFVNPLMVQESRAQESRAQVSSTSLSEAVKKVTWSEGIDHDFESALKQEQASLVGSQITELGIVQSQTKLTQVLRAQGFLIGQVVVTASDRELLRKTGTLNFTIFPGKVGQIEIKNASSVDTGWVDSVVTHNLCPEGLGDSCVLRKANFERMTQLLQDTVGLQTGALEFSPEGMPIGQSKLTVTTTAKHAQIKGSVGFDNQGFRSSGPYRTGASLSANNLLGVGDVLGLSAFVSNQGAVSGAIDFSGPLSVNGLRWQTTLSRSQFYVPNNSNGFGNAASIGVAYPLVRGLDSNWTASLNAVAVESKASLANGLGDISNKNLVSGQITLDGNSGDRSIALGQNSWYVRTALTAGNVKDSVSGGNNPALGSYTKLAFQGVGKVVLSDEHSIYGVLNVRGQFANTNLDPYEKMLIGGYSGVRAYSMEQGSFNQGTITTAELRQSFNTDWGQFTPVAFVDYANGWINHATYSNWQTNSGYPNPNLANHMVLADAGLGVDWNGFDGLVLSAAWARRLPFSPAALNNAGNANSQYWFIGQYRF